MVATTSDPLSLGACGFSRISRGPRQPLRLVQISLALAKPKPCAARARPNPAPTAQKPLYKPRNGRFQRRNCRENGASNAQALSLQAARRTDPRQRPHPNAQIVSAGVD